MTTQAMHVLFSTKCPFAAGPPFAFAVSDGPPSDTKSRPEPAPAATEFQRQHRLFPNNTVLLYLSHTHECVHRAQKERTGPLPVKN